MLGLCGVCRRFDLTMEQVAVHRRRHGERRFDLANARQAAQALAKLPRSTPGYPMLQLLASPRLGLGEEARASQDLDAVERVLDQPGGVGFLKELIDLDGAAFHQLLGLAEKFRPSLATHLRAAVGGSSAMIPK